MNALAVPYGPGTAYETEFNTNLPIRKADRLGAASTG